MRMKWDARKAAANLKKHRVSFEEAGTDEGDMILKVPGRGFEGFGVRDS